MEYCMSTKEKVKEEIDRMPDELVEKVYKYIEEYLKNKNKKNIVSTYSLKGSFDHINIRESAYE